MDGSDKWNIQYNRSGIVLIISAKALVVRRIHDVFVISPPVLGVLIDIPEDILDSLDNVVPWTL